MPDCILQTLSFPAYGPPQQFELLIIIMFFWCFIHLILNNVVTLLVCLLYGVITEGHSKSLKQKQHQAQPVRPPIDISWPAFVEVSEARNSWRLCSFSLIISVLITATFFFLGPPQLGAAQEMTILYPNNECSKVVGTCSLGIQQDFMLRGLRTRKAWNAMCCSEFRCCVKSAGLSRQFSQLILIQWKSIIKQNR